MSSRASGASRVHPSNRIPPPKQTSEEAAKKRIHTSPSPPSRPVIVSTPLPLEVSRMRDREIKSAINRATLNAERVTQECAPYLEEGRRVKERIADLTHEIDRIGLQLDRFRVTLADRHGLLGDSKQKQKQKQNQKQEHIFSLQTLYAMERVQKEEELMRLRDRLIEINEIIRSIYRKYEDARPFNGVGGRSRLTRTRTRTHARSKSKKHKHKWSLKYKRSIDCKHPKGFSQKQHCKYGRKNLTMRRK
jgi:hypothetical protein